MSPLNRTGTRAGRDPPSSRRAASIAGTSPVTSRCHLHVSKARETGATKTLGGAQEMHHAPRRRRRGASSLPAPLPPRPRPRPLAEVTSAADAAGRCSPAGLRPSCLTPSGWRGLPHWYNRSPTPLLACSASSRSLPGPQLFRLQVNLACRLLPGSGVFHFLQVQHLMCTCCMHT